MGAVSVGRPETVEGVTFNPVDVGNPHAVVFGDLERLEELGPLLETHEHFPNRTNVQVVRRDGPNEVTVRVWERGVGEATASGSRAVGGPAPCGWSPGAVAAAAVGEGETMVHFSGGDLRVTIRDGRATLVGPAEPVPHK